MRSTIASPSSQRTQRAYLQSCVRPPIHGGKATPGTEIPAQEAAGLRELIPPPAVCILSPEYLSFFKSFWL